MVRLLCAFLGALSLVGWASDSLAQDVTPPSVVSITPATTGPSPAVTENFTVVFSEAVTGVDLSDFTLTTVGVSAAVHSMSCSGASCIVNVGGISGAGSLRLDLKSSGTGIQDAALNAIAGGYTSGGVRMVSAPPAPVPTMTEWAMILLGLMLAGFAALTIQRRAEA